MNRLQQDSSLTSQRCAICSVFCRSAQSNYSEKNMQQQFSICCISCNLNFSSKSEKGEILQDNASDDRTYTEGFTDHDLLLTDLRDLQILHDSDFLKEQYEENISIGKKWIHRKVVRWIKENRELKERYNNLLNEDQSMTEKLKHDKDKCQRLLHKIQQRINELHFINHQAQ